MRSLWAVFTRATLCQRGISYGNESVSLSVRPSVTNRCSIKILAEQIDPHFGTESILCLSYTVLYRNSGTFKK